MVTTRRVTTVLRVLLVLAFGLVAVLQLLSVPGGARYAAGQHGGFTASDWLLLGVAEVELLCVQVVVVATWCLLGMVRQDRIFTDDAFAWVDRIIAALVVGWLVWLGFGLAVLAAADDPGAPLVAAVIGVAITVVTLLMVVMRALLRQATELRSDLDAVI